MKINICLLLIICFFDSYYLAKAMSNDILSLNDTLSPKIKGVLDDAIDVKSALALDSIRIYDANLGKLKIDSFRLTIYAEYVPIDTFVFDGSAAPNIFRRYQLYRLDKNGTEQSDYDSFGIIVYYSDSKKRIFESTPKMIYFSVSRECINGSISDN